MKRAIGPFKQSTPACTFAQEKTSSLLSSEPEDLNTLVLWYFMLESSPDGGPAIESIIRFPS